MRSLVSCPLVVLLAAIIHTDYHLARPHHMRLSLDWDYHWLVALPVSALAAFGAQVVEPVAEELFYNGRFGMEVTGFRWMVFAEFMAAGVVAFAATAAVLEMRARRREPPIRTAEPTV